MSAQGDPLDATTNEPESVDLTWGLKIPMRDGVRLNATLYRPQEAARTPVIFLLTPYIADSYHERAIYFARHGYAFALVDCRGRGNSEGVFDPFFQEAHDGYNVVAWLVAQPWCDGSVAMWGGSYSGFNQWLTLRESPPGLKTIVPAASAHAGVDFPFLKNIYYSEEIRWLTLTSGVTGNAALVADADFWIARYRHMFCNHLPFRQLDTIVGNTSTVFQKWMDHPEPGPFWDRATLSGEDYDHIDMPILSITGVYDDDQPGALACYRRHMASSSLSKEAHYLVIGPWDHAGTRTPAREVGGLTFSEACLLDLNKLHLDWYTWTMRGGERPDFLEDRLAYYVTGAEQWKYAPNLDAIPVDVQPFYLASDGYANEVFHSGRLDPLPPEQAQPDVYVYDPLDTRPAELERGEIKDYLTDQTYTLNLFGNGLVYHSQPFERHTEITGCFKLETWIALDVPDTDFCATVWEVLPDGSVVRLSQDFLRARYRLSLRRPELVHPGQINAYSFDGFTFVSREVSRGSRLRLVINCPNSIYIQKNYNAGGEVASESGADALTAHVTLYHDAEHPSCLYVPIARGK